MGREIKRVALDFKYPINKMIWVGYHNPYSPLGCKECDGSGESAPVKALSDSWYNGERWAYKITQDEVQALVDGGRLIDFKEVPTAEEVNEWSKKGFGHDCINKWICVKQRAARLGITSPDCDCCKGKGYLWPSDEFEELSENWQSIEPPAGEGYQLWSTTTEGTPMSPVFETPELLATWLYENNASVFGSSTATYGQWMKFILGPGWCVSAVMSNNKIGSPITI